MNPTGQELERVAAATLQDYADRAESFREGTRDHDVSQNITALLRYIEAGPPAANLDFGCGPGRDLKTFARLGHAAVGLEGCARFAAMARAEGSEVWEQNFLDLDLPDARFDGIFANASLFHVASQELARSPAVASDAEIAWRAVQLEPAWPKRGRLVSRALLRLS
ncbi:MAG TPA: class I SAM-dependent methyltransferase [Rhizomicrobium sp.]|jgi:SAM-dependent methyltransferase